MGTIIILEMAAAWNMVTMMRTENISTGRAMEKRNDIIKVSNSFVNVVSKRIKNKR